MYVCMYEGRQVATIQPYQEQLQRFIKGEFPGENFETEDADIEVEVSRYPRKWQQFMKSLLVSESTIMDILVLFDKVKSGITNMRSAKVNNFRGLQGAMTINCYDDSRVTQLNVNDEIVQQ